MNYLLELLGKIFLLSLLTLGSIAVFIGFTYFVYWIICGVI